MKLETLLHKLESASSSSPELDADVASVFPSALNNVTRSIDAVVQLIETELPGWWWTCGYCIISDDASLYPPGSSQYPYFPSATVGPDFRTGPAALRLLNHPKWGKVFDRGFHCDLHGGTVPLSMLIVFVEAKIALAKVELSTDPKRIREEEREAVRKAEMLS